MFEDDPRVLYFSVHRYEKGAFYPGGPDGGPEAVGKGKGAGFNVNIGWNTRGMGDPEYLMAFMQVLMPIALQYQPELVLISAGFDAARGDPLVGCGLGRHRKLRPPNLIRVNTPLSPNPGRV